MALTDCQTRNGLGCTPLKFGITRVLVDGSPCSPLTRGVSFRASGKAPLHRFQTDEGQTTTKFRRCLRFRSRPDDPRNEAKRYSPGFRCGVAVACRQILEGRKRRHLCSTMEDRLRLVPKKLVRVPATGAGTRTSSGVVRASPEPCRQLLGGLVSPSGERTLHRSASGVRYRTETDERAFDDRTSQELRHNLR
mgnify:CR=1 FL=1